MASVITCSLSSHAAHSTRLGRKQGRCNNATLLLSSPSPWTSSVVGNALASPISCKRSCRVSPRASVQPSQQVLTRKSFPPAPEFVFGAGTASYQIEGAWDEGGKGPSVWDHYCHTFPERIVGGSNGDVAVDAYHMYEEDVKMLKAMGMDAYRFSISWPRILPDGTLKGGVNEEGIQYYNNLINTLIKYGIKPYVTLFHWETPQALHEEYGAFLSRKIVDDYKDYASVCFERFGDRVKNWFTFNEPYVFCCNAYGAGKHAPGRCSHGGTCAVPQGNSLVEPYTVGHNLILAHAEAAQLYMEKYKGDEGEIGMSLVSMGYEPYDKTQHIHVQAQERSIDFHLGWFLEPLFRGDYPFSMRALVRERLPHFTDEEKKRITGSYNMLGLNYYTSRFSRAVDHSPASTPVINTEDNYSTPLTTGPDGTHIGQNTGTDWLYMYPEGMRHLLMIIKDRYGNPPIYITENGVGDMDKGDLSMEKALNDDMRLNYLKEHIAMLKQAKDSGANVHGHFTWSLVDNFEWQNGYTQRFGLIYVDRKDKLKRHMKKSAKWFAEFNGVSGDGNIKVDSSAVPRAVPAAAAVAA